jgi:hypothetical protein
VVVSGFLLMLALLAHGITLPFSQQLHLLTNYCFGKAPYESLVMSPGGFRVLADASNAWHRTAVT